MRMRGEVRNSPNVFADIVKGGAWLDSEMREVALPSGLYAMAGVARHWALGCFVLPSGRWASSRAGLEERA